MPPLQDSALHLSDARKTELEVFFYFIYLFCLSLIMDLVLQVHKALVWVKSGLLSSRCCILQICRPRCLPMALIIWPTHKFLFFSWALGPHGLDRTQKAFPPDCKPTLILLGKSVPQLSCSVSMSFLYPYLFYFPHSNHLDLASSYFDEDRIGLEAEVTDEEIKGGSGHWKLGNPLAQMAFMQDFSNG